MTRRDEIDLEIRNLAVRNVDKVHALFELPRIIYSQIVADNATRKKPYKVSYERIQKIIHSMSLTY